METESASCQVSHSSRTSMGRSRISINRLSTLVDDSDRTFKLPNFKARQDDSAQLEGQDNKKGAAVWAY